MNASRFLVPVVLLAALSACHRSTESSHLAATDDGPPQSVAVASVRREARPGSLALAGTVRAAQRAQLATKLMGTVRSQPLALGQHVEAGQRLIALDVEEIDAKVRQAETQLATAQRDLARERHLLTQGASTAEGVRGLEDREALLLALVREAKVMLGYAELRAPFAGTIVRFSVREGDLASPGQPLVEIEGQGSREIDVNVPDSLREIPLGTEVIVHTESGVAFKATVRELSSSADGFSRSVSATLATPTDAPIRSGQSVRVAWPTAAQPALTIPADAVSRFGQLERVFVVTPEGVAHLRLIRTLAEPVAETVVLAGLEDGERVIRPYPQTLRDGSRVTLTP